MLSPAAFDIPSPEIPSVKYKLSYQRQDQATNTLPRLQHSLQTRPTKTTTPKHFHLHIHHLTEGSLNKPLLIGFTQEIRWQPSWLPRVLASKHALFFTLSGALGVYQGIPFWHPAHQQGANLSRTSMDQRIWTYNLLGSLPAAFPEDVRLFSRGEGDGRTATISEAGYPAHHRVRPR